MLLYCLCTARSCSNGEEGKAARDEVRANAVRDSIRLVIAADSLPGTTRRAYEESAVQKLADLGDYLKFVSDITLDRIVRRKAAEMAVGLFIADSVVVKFNAADKTGRQDFTVAKLLQDGFRPGILNFDSARVIKPLTRIADSIYIGQLSCWEIGADREAGIQPDFSGNYQTIDFYAIRYTSILGSDTLRSWKVRLGNISYP